MPADLSALAREARENIDVPPVPFAVRAAARAAAPRADARPRPRVLAASLAGISLIAAAAAAAHIIAQSQIIISPTQDVTVGFDSFGGQRPYTRRKNSHGPTPPTARQIRDAVRAMDFKVTLPAGVPGDQRPIMLTRAGSGAMMLYYNLPGAWRRDNHLLAMLLANRQDVLNEGSPAVRRHLYTLKLPSQGAQRWRIGDEDVIVFKSTMTPAEAEHLHRAMLAAAAKRE